MEVTAVKLLQLDDLALLAPELTLIIAVIVISIIDLALPRRVNRDIIGGLSLLGVLISLGWVVYKLYQRIYVSGEVYQVVQLLNQSYRVDDFALLLKIVFLVGTSLILLMSMGHIQHQNIPHRGEYYYLLLPATLGAMIMTSSGDMMTLYIGLELLSITSYILVGMKKNDCKSTEGAFKYAVLGSIASAFILYGMSFLYGMTGSTKLNEIAAGLAIQAAFFEPLIYVSFLLMVVGFGFKVAAAPFHAWSPDVYEAAPTPITAFLTVVSKGASLTVLFRIFYSVYFGLGVNQNMEIYYNSALLLLALATVSMIMGTTMALKQHNVKRLLALSGIANTGYLLTPIGLNILEGSGHSSNFSEFLYYLLAYLPTTVGAFAVHTIIERSAGHDKMKGYAGLYYRCPKLAVAMTVFVLSLAGIPVTAGFMGKLYIIFGAVAGHAIWLAIVMMVTSVISFYFYFGFIRQMYMRANGKEDIQVSITQGIVISGCVIVVLLLGMFPNIVWRVVQSVFSIATDLMIRL